MGTAKLVDGVVGNYVKSEIAPGPGDLISVPYPLFDVLIFTIICLTCAYTYVMPGLVRGRSSRAATYDYRFFSSLSTCYMFCI